MAPLQPPGNYDDASLQILVDRDGMFARVSDMQNEAQLIANATIAIVGIWNDLKLGWAGSSASEAQQCNTEWTVAVQALSGTAADPDSGAFSKVAQAVALASINYGEAEDSNQKMFRGLTISLNAPPGNLPPPSRSDSQSPITETAPTAP
jgi:hypothetical protein